MRIALTLDDKIAARLQVESRNTGCSLESIVDEYLRAGLAQRRAASKATAFSVEPVSMGVPRPDCSYDDIGRLLEDIEGPEHR